MTAGQQRAAIYARFSSHNQRDESIEIQVEKSREYCAERDLDVVRVYSDFAQTGRNVKRAEFQRMMDDAKLGLFDYVVIYKVTRIMRNRDEMALARIMLRKAGVEILYAGESLGEGSTRVLNLGMLEVLAEWESAIDSERIRDGIQKNAERGMANGRSHYGWDIIDGYYQLNERESAVLHKMKNMLFAGSTIAEIKRALDNERTRGGKHFTHDVITKLLKREQNCGVYSYAGVRIEDGMPAHWSREEQDMILSILSTRGRKHRKHDKAEDFPLSGVLWCAECDRYFVGTSGTSATGRVYQYYKCNTCRRTFRREVIEDAVCDAVLQAIAMPEVRERICEVMALFNEEQRESEHPESERLRKEIKRIDAAFERVWQAIEDGIAPPGGKERIEELRSRKAALETELREAEATEHAELTDEDIMAWLDHIAQEPDPLVVIDTFVRLIELDRDELRVYFAFDNWGNNFMPQKRKSEPSPEDESSHNSLMVEPRKIFANSVIETKSSRIKVSRSWFVVITTCERSVPKTQKSAHAPTEKARARAHTYC